MAVKLQREVIFDVPDGYRNFDTWLESVPGDIDLNKERDVTPEENNGTAGVLLSFESATDLRRFVYLYSHIADQTTDELLVRYFHPKQS